MKINGITIIGILIILILVGLTYYKSEIGTNNNNEQKTKIDTTRILLNDRALNLYLIKRNLANIERIQNGTQDTFIKKDLVKLLKEIYQENETFTDSIQNLKNKDIFPFKAEYNHLKNKIVNIWAILLIIIISGILGGFARTKYYLVDDILKELETIQVSVKNNISYNTLENNEELNQKLHSLTNRINDLKDKDNEKVTINIVFGIIASSLSMLALTTFSSKILDFQSEIDYFIFLGYCLLGAVFAKNWIKSLYDRINNSKSTPLQNTN